MRVLLVHNNYGRNAVGGERNVLEAEKSGLIDAGCQVDTFMVTNHENLFNVVVGVLFFFFNPFSFISFYKCLRRGHYDIVHVHNYWYQLSPSILFAAKIHGVPVVKTIHNFRFLCGNSLFYRNSMPCESCLDGKHFRGVVKNCSQNRGKSVLAYLFIKLHAWFGFFENKISAFIVLSNFSKSKLLSTGICEDKIYVKGNFSPFVPQKGNRSHEHALFVGRLTEEKGILDLLKYWRNIKYPLVIVGLDIHDLSRDNHNPYVEFVGLKTRDEVQNYFNSASFLVAPSRWYEGFPLSIIEAMSQSIPVLSTNLGARAELIRDGVNGFLYDLDDEISFREKLNVMVSNKDLLASMGERAHETVQRKFHMKKNIQELLVIYNSVLKA